MTYRPFQFYTSSVVILPIIFSVPLWIVLFITSCRFFQVFLILHGDDCVSDPIELKSTAGKPLFERSSCDVFVLR